MASQEFLASFAVDVDESGVTRLKTVLEENRDLANEVAAAFQAATAAIKEYEAAASGNSSSSGESGRDSGSGKPSGIAGSTKTPGGNADTGNRDAGVAGANRDGFWISDNPMQNLARLQLGGVLEGDDAPAMPSTARGLVLRNMETMFLGQASRDTKNASKELISWKDIGLDFDPTTRAGYSDLAAEAQEIMREPLQQARQYMKKAMDAEEAGLDGSEYIQMVDEVLRKPLEQVRDMVNDFDFGDETGAGGKKGQEEETESSLELDTSAADEALESFREKAAEPVSVEVTASDSLGEGNDQSGTLNIDVSEAKANIESVRKEASKPVSMTGNASGMVSAARSAYWQIEDIFSVPVTMTVNVVKNYSGSNEGNDDPSGNPARMSTGGRFTKPTDVQVAEDGDAEYIIPVKKENRAIPLLRQLLSELSPSARASLSLGDGAQPLAGGLTAGTATAAQITQNNQNVSAPVSIEVHSAGANAEQVGLSVYNAAERYLLRTMKGVFA